MCSLFTNLIPIPNTHLFWYIEMKATENTEFSRTTCPKQILPKTNNDNNVKSRKQTKEHYCGSINESNKYWYYGILLFSCEEATLKSSYVNSCSLSFTCNALCQSKVLTQHTHTHKHTMIKSFEKTGSTYTEKCSWCFLWKIIAFDCP